MTVAKGTEVFFDKYSGTNLKYEGQEYLVLHEKDILAYIK
ncbi:co-chaperonin GroES domain protein [Lactobacillus iners LactinV 03V1-b]|nr:co-chaperonin GroES domain protein [Lactobacillus iners LactinV 03V1-b]